jgi:hypothetical protein
MLWVSAEGRRQARFRKVGRDRLVEGLLQDGYEVIRRYKVARSEEAERGYQNK